MATREPARRKSDSPRRSRRQTGSGRHGHRGSLFGGLPGRPQPNQKGFESSLLVAMEARSGTAHRGRGGISRIGDLMVPPALSAHAGAADQISAERPERARYLVRAYSDITARHDLIEAMLERLPVHPGRSGWRVARISSDYAALAEARWAFTTRLSPRRHRTIRADGGDH
jgi:tRNA 2-selenouridine synthase